MAKKERITIYTDGGCFPNPGPGGYAAIIKRGDRLTELSGGFRHTTNNRMEIIAAINALESIGPSGDIMLISDSQYLVNSINKGWAQRWKQRNWMRNSLEKASNIDLWERLLKLHSLRQVTFKWIRGHNGNKYNERCHDLAVIARKSPSLLVDQEYEEAAKSLETALEIPVGPLVYFISDGKGAIKIGTTTDLRRRLDELQVGNPAKLQVVSLLQGGKRKERQIQKRLSHLHIRGEWYQYGPEVDILLKGQSK